MRPTVPSHPDEDRLLELAYGELGAAEARTLRQHVDGCARCRGVLDGIAEVRTAFRSVPPEPAPDRGLDSLLAYGEQAAARARSRRGGLRILGLLSAAAAFAVVWLVLPAPHRQTEAVARAPATPASGVLAQADTPAGPAQGDRVRDEMGGDRALKTPAPAAVQPVAKAERPALEEQAPPARRATPEAEAKRKDVAKLDVPTGRAVAAGSPAQLRAEAQDRSATGSNLSGLVGSAGGRPSDGKGAALGGAAGAAGMAKENADLGHADDGELQAAARQAPSGPASAGARAPAKVDARAQEAAKIAAAPLTDALASSERGRGSPAVTPVAPSEPLAKAVPSGGKDGASTAASVPPRSVPMKSMRVGAGSPEKQARLAEIARRLETATGDERKALLLERCEIHASLQMGPDAVLSCSIVGREFPGTPEAKRAAEIARGFSVQLPTEAPER